jgi:hypothetical protein
MALTAREIGYAMHDLMMEGIKYEKVAGEFWEMQRIEEDADKGSGPTRVEFSKVAQAHRKRRGSPAARRIDVTLRRSAHSILFLSRPTHGGIISISGRGLHGCSYNFWQFSVKRHLKRR